MQPTGPAAARGHRAGPPHRPRQAPLPSCRGEPAWGSPTPLGLNPVHGNPRRTCLLYPPARCTELPTLLSPEIPSERGTAPPSTTKPEQGTVLRGAQSRDGRASPRAIPRALPCRSSAHWGQSGFTGHLAHTSHGEQMHPARAGCSPQARPQTGMMGEQGGVAELWERRTGGAQDTGRTEGAPFKRARSGEPPTEPGQGARARIGGTTRGRAHVPEFQKRQLPPRWAVGLRLRELLLQGLGGGPTSDLLSHDPAVPSQRGHCRAPQQPQPTFLHCPTATAL